MKKFEQCLQEIHADQYRGLDDEMYEDFLLWMDEELKVETLLDWHKKWLKVHDLELQMKILKDLKTNLL